MLQKVLDSGPLVVGVLVGLNVVLGGVAAILHAFGKTNAESMLGKASGFLAKGIDLLQGNLAHK